MPTSRAKKEEAVELLTERFGACQSAVFVDYRGLTVAEMQALRKELRAVGSHFVVAKNRLIRLVLERVGLSLTAPDGADHTTTLTKGLTAVAFGYDTPNAPAEVLAKLAKINDKIVLKGGFCGTTPVVGAAGVDRIARMRSKDACLADVVRILKGAPSRLRVVAGAAPRKLIALRDVLKQAEEAA
jgi:large subunit ribosomal protein L10